MWTHKQIANTATAPSTLIEVITLLDRTKPTWRPTPVAEWFRLLIISALNRSSSHRCWFKPSSGCFMWDTQSSACWWSGVFSRESPSRFLIWLKVNERILMGCKTQLKKKSTRKHGYKTIKYEKRLCSLSARNHTKIDIIFCHNVALWVRLSWNHPVCRKNNLTWPSMMLSAGGERGPI